MSSLRKQYSECRLLFLILAALTVAPPVAAGSLEQTRKLVAILQSEAGFAERARACQQLAVVGTKEAVPALAALLGDEKLGQYARDGLEAIGDPSAAAALRSSLARLQGNQLIGLVNSIGVRRDAQAVDALAGLARSSSSVAGDAALIALGRIATPEATRVLQRVLKSGSPKLRAAAAEGCLLVADRRFEQGERNLAIGLYDGVRLAEVPGPLRATATHGAILARGVAGLPLLFEQLQANDLAMRDIALRAIRELSGTEVTPAVVAQLDKVNPVMQALLIAALVDRDDERALPAVEALVSSGNDTVRLAALKALGKIGRSSSLTILLRTIAANGNAEESAAALASLARIRAPDADAVILAASRTAESAIRVKLMGVLAERNAENATRELIWWAGSGDPEISMGSLRALALLARPENLPALIALSIASPDDASKTLADRAIVNTAMKVLEPERRAEAVLTAYRQSNDAGPRASLLRPLGAIARSMGGNYDVFVAMRPALNDPSETVRTAALQSLSEWPDATPALSLLEFVNRDPPPVQRERALRSAIRMATGVATGRDATPLNSLDFFRMANQAVRTTPEKLMIVSGLGNLKRIEALRLLQPYLDDPAVKSEAALAAVQIAPALASSGHASEARRVMEKIAAATEMDPDLRRRAARLAQGAPDEDAKSNATTSPTPTSASASPSGFVSLFNGKDLSGWEGNPEVWRVRNEGIVGGSLEGNPRNEFLATTRSFRNFVFRCEYKLVGTAGFINGGVQFRSVRTHQPPNEMIGYQADLGSGHTGSLYDESRRRKFLVRATDDAIKRLEKPGDWNRYEIRGVGSRIEIRLNDETTVEYTETEPLPQDGLIALQIHGNCKAEISFRNIAIQELP